MALETWFNGIIIVHLMLSQVLKPSAILSQCQVKIKWSPNAINIQVSYSSCGDLFDYLMACKKYLSWNLLVGWSWANQGISLVDQSLFGCIWVNWIGYICICCLLWDVWMD